MQIAFGSGLFYATPLMDAYGNALASPTPILLGIMQEASVDLSYDSKELFGSEQFAVDAARGQGKLSGKAKAAQISLSQMNALVFGQTLQPGQVLVHHATTPQDIPAGGKIIVTPPGAGLLAGDLGVRGGGAAPFTRVLAAPAKGNTPMTQVPVNTLSPLRTKACRYLSITATRSPPARAFPCATCRWAICRCSRVSCI